MAGKKKQQVYTLLPVEIHQAAKEAAESVGISLSAWIALRVAQGVRNWQSPLTGQRAATVREAKGAYDGWHCWQCNKAADECQRKSSHQKGQWRRTLEDGTVEAWEG